MIIKGWELMKEVSEGKLNLKQKVSTTNSEYKNCTIEFVLKDIAFNIMDLDFELIQDEIIESATNSIEGIVTNNSKDTEKEAELRRYIVNNFQDIKKLVQVVKQLNKKLEEK